MLYGISIQGDYDYPLRGFFNIPLKGARALPGRGRPLQFPAFAGTRERENAGIMAEPIASLEDKEFPKIWINSDKFTGFFDK